MKPVTVYTGPNCKWCTRAIAMLDERNVPYQLRNVYASPSVAEEFTKDTNGATTVPQILVGDTLIGGHDDLLKIINTPEFQQMIGDT